MIAIIPATSLPHADIATNLISLLRYSTPFEYKYCTIPNVSSAHCLSINSGLRLCSVISSG